MMLKFAGLVIMGAVGFMFADGLEAEAAMTALTMPIAAMTAYILLGTA
jgi:hypothetical protein